MSIVEKVKTEILKLNEAYLQGEDKYNFWEQHFKFVVYESLHLAEIYGADKEIVELGAMLHDIALVSKVGTKKDHHVNGAKLAEEMLIKFKYPKYKTKRVVGCVLHHRSSKNAENVEEVCVADADILAHFDNIPMVFECMYKFHNFETIEESNKFLKSEFERDFNDLSDRTKKTFKSDYNKILNVIFKSDNIN